MHTISTTIRKTQTADGAILLDVKRGQIFCLNAIASTILEMLASGHREREIVDHLSAACGVEIETVRSDVRDFIEALNRHHVLEEGSPVTTKESEVNRDSTDAL
jgi:hypothetical protein